MSRQIKLEEFGWPSSRLGEAVGELIRRAGLAGAEVAAVPQVLTQDDDPPRTIEWTAGRFDCESESLETTLRTVETELGAAYPAILGVSPQCFLAILNARAGNLCVITPDLTLRSVTIRAVVSAIRGEAEAGKRNALENLLAESGLSASRRARALNLLLDEQLGDRRFNRCWILRSRPGQSSARLLRESGTVRNSAALVTAHALQYGLSLLAWIVVGQLSFSGRMDRAWLLAWALLLFTLIPFRVWTTSLQGAIAIGLGGFLKRRLLVGAMRLGPEEMRHAGIGSFLGQALEAEAVETLALSGGIAGLLAAIEILVSGFVLGRLALILAMWCGLTVFLAWRFLRRFRQWTEHRMSMTQDLVEAMVGHRTRLAQQARHAWHEEEDQALHEYLRRSKLLDRIGAGLIAAIPRGWLIAGLACIAPDIVNGQAASAQTAVALGGVILAFSAFKRLTACFADIAAALVAWERIAHLYKAATRKPLSGDALNLGQISEEPAAKIIEADRLTFRYRKEGAAVLQGCSLTIRRGDRILLEGPSGGGKTTFASMLSGARQPESGLLLVNGLDRYTLGDEQWRERVASAPQFHENHILTETLAFNLLMGRQWPPTQRDMEEAELVCRELGLGNLLDSMPSGLMQMVGEGGWQLSHGERSRIFIARALLQNAEMVILDESFGALDPENLQIALECTLRRAKTLMVIAHP